MSHDTDMMVDRRRLKRRLAVWRSLAIVALVAGVIGGVARFEDWAVRDHVARIAVSGIIVDDPALIESLAAIAGDDKAKALIVNINSPGGTFVGGESLYLALRDVAEHKPVLAVMGTVATSAGYMVAIASDRIYARNGTITGSIGVLMQTTDITGLLENIGVSAEAIKSGPLKAAPSPLEPLTDEVRAATQSVIDDMHALFTSMVAERRGLDEARVRGLADGRVYSGRQALGHDLIDEIGGETEARSWLASEKGVPASLPTRDVEIEQLGDQWFDALGSFASIIKVPERLMLDGLMSVWHPGGG